MFNNGEIKDFGKFCVPRYYGKHEGVDVSGKKTDPIYCELNGVLSSVEYEKGYGNVVRIYTNLKYYNEKYNGIILYHSYAHLFKWNDHIKDLPIQQGIVIAQMGNSGACQTFDMSKKEWRFVTNGEANDPNNQNGVHLHFDCFVFEKNHPEELIRDMQNKTGLKTEEIMLKQWNKIYLNPVILLKFLKGE